MIPPKCTMVQLSCTFQCSNPWIFKYLYNLISFTCGREIIILRKLSKQKTQKLGWTCRKDTLWICCLLLPLAIWRICQSSAFGGLESFDTKMSLYRWSLKWSYGIEVPSPITSWIILVYWCKYPSKIEWDLTNGPLSKLLELLDTQV